MRNILYLIVVFVVIVAISGCITVKKVVKERTDQDTTGNKGYIQGQIPEGPSVTRGKSREYIDIKVEIPTWEEFKSNLPKPEKKEEMPHAEEETERPSAITEQPSQAYTAAPVEEPIVEEIEEPIAEEIEEPIVEEPIIEEPIAVEPALPTLYKVKKKDTLGHIAKKFYGKASKWTLIYEANIDKIDDPKKLKPGSELVIPELEEELEYAK